MHVLKLSVHPASPNDLGCLGNGARDRQQLHPLACIVRCWQVHALQGLNRLSAWSASHAS